MWTIAYGLSILLHSALIALLMLQANPGSGKEDQAGKEGQDQASTQSDIRPKNESAENAEPEDKTVTVSLIEIPKKKEKQAPENSVKECIGDLWYGGIGIVINFFDDSVMEVAAGYPAEKAGLQKGDIIVGGSMTIKGDPGTPVHITIARNGQVFDVELIREKICVEAPKLPHE